MIIKSKKIIIDLLFGVMFLVIIYSLTDNLSYDRNVRHLNGGSSTFLMLMNLLLYSIDKLCGKIGVFSFHGIIAVTFLWRAYFHYLNGRKKDEKIDA